MNKVVLSVLIVLTLFCACSEKEVKQGTIIYNIGYQYPDSLSKYFAYLPKTAIVHFRGDSTISLQQAIDESTTVITNKPAGFMRVLLKSINQKYQVDYSKADQAEEAAAMPVYTYKASTETKTIANHKALKYILTDKTTGEIDEAWFTKEISVVPNSLTVTLNTTYGVPLEFTVNQHGIIIKTTVKQIKFEPIADGTFATPAGYTLITPKQLRDMPVDN